MYSAIPYMHFSFCLESKRQVLANLANFAYDPINYPYIRSQKVIDLFIEQLGVSDDKKLLAFSAAGLCNLANGILLHFFLIEIGFVLMSVLSY